MSANEMRAYATATVWIFGGYPDPRPRQVTKQLELKKFRPAWGISRNDFPSFQPFSLVGRTCVSAFELIMTVAGLDPNAPWVACKSESARLLRMKALAREATGNLYRDIRDRVIRPEVEAYDEDGGRNPSRDLLSVDAADAFTRRIGGSARWNQLLAEREKAGDQAPAPELQGVQPAAEREQQASSEAAHAEAGDTAAAGNQAATDGPKTTI